jgi:hypothetical protein
MSGCCGGPRRSNRQSAVIGSPNQVEAITANFEKREPKFWDVR